MFPLGIPLTVCQSPSACRPSNSCHGLILLVLCHSTIIHSHTQIWDLYAMISTQFQYGCSFSKPTGLPSIPSHSCASWCSVSTPSCVCWRYTVRRRQLSWCWRKRAREGRSNVCTSDTGFWFLRWLKWMWSFDGCVLASSWKPKLSKISGKISIFLGWVACEWCLYVHT